MANQLRGEHTFTFEGREYTLALDMDAFTEACQVLDIGINGLLASLSSPDPKPHVIRAIFYGAMKKHNPLPLNECMSFVSAYGLEDMVKELSELAAKTMPKASAEGNVPPAPAPKPNRTQRRASETTSGGGKRKR